MAFLLDHSFQRVLRYDAMMMSSLSSVTMYMCCCSLPLNLSLANSDYQGVARLSQPSLHTRAASSNLGHCRRGACSMPAKCFQWAPDVNSCTLRRTSPW